MEMDLNSDLGEQFGVWPGGPDDALFSIITSANIACGFHAGDPRSIERSVRVAAERGVAVGAHPGFPDLVGFGRRAMDCADDQIRTDVLYQVAAVAGFCRAAGVEMQHVKAHGALSNMAAKDSRVARAIVAGVRAYDPALRILTHPGALHDAASHAGQPVITEAFADRAYLKDGQLAPRSMPGSVITDPEAAAERMLLMVRQGTLPTVDGPPIAVNARSICIHSDSPGAVETARAVRQLLEANGVTFRNLLA